MECQALALPETSPKGEHSNFFSSDRFSEFSVNKTKVRQVVARMLTRPYARVSNVGIGCYWDEVYHWRMFGGEN